MAPRPPDDDNRDPYAHSTEVNTNPSWLAGPKGAPALGEGVKANRDDLTGYSYNLDQVSGNVTNLSQALMSTMDDLLDEAFPAGPANGLSWTADFLKLAGHNAGRLQQFLGYMSMGIRNVAMAAQAVANAYGNTDETSAANMNAIDFAFGDKSKAPPGIPRWLVDRIPTWEQFAREHPEQAVVVPETGVPPVNAQTSADGHTTTVTVTLPDGRVMTTVTTEWAYYGATGRTQTVSINGKEISSTQTSSYGGQSRTVESETVYDKQGRPRTQVTSRTDESVTTGPDGSQQTDRKVTTYSYDNDGKKTDENTNASSVSVGADPNQEPPSDPGQDPATKRIQELTPKPDTTILAPGPLDGSAPRSPGSGGVSV